ncbi:hypothetical protein E4T50_01009 [Aureobasidium sp. EXF-12298]|jgi:hypothetical protein|nr:hypothetical protein E4T50_01009 [Aureobasidium sp. EXF-12298]KAI4766521.1 hypothetical protein E4T51_00573 [Aureobasidium sp. EXF-12344]KAI4783892.1 hypothetical protein E4T52_01188 [Aureobasidium sp. EXF-3400]
MPSYKELRAQGLSTYPATYPTPAINARGESVYIHQRVKWTGNFLDAELEHIEVPANNFSSLVPANTATNTTQQGPSSKDLTMFSHQSSFSKQALAVPYPAAPERDEKGLFPARPENLPVRPPIPAQDAIRERSFGKLITNERPLTVDESIARNSQFLVDSHRWMSWASKMPKEWDLLTEKEYNHFTSVMTPAESQVDKPNVDKDSQIVLLFVVVGVLLWAFGAASLIQLLPLVVLMVGVIQINRQNSLDPIGVLSFATLNPIESLNLLGYWTLGMLSVAVLVVSSLVTSLLWLLNQVVASLAGANSGFRSVSLDATAFVHDAKQVFTRNVSVSRLATWIIGALLAYWNIKLMQEPSTACILVCMVLCIFLVICVVSSFVERPRSAANDSNPVIPPPTTPPATPAAQVVPTPSVATTLFGRSGVAFADPLSTLQSVSIKSLPDGLRPKPLVYDFGTPIPGPLSKDFGARRTPEGLYQVQPTFFTSPPRQTFT